MIRLVLPVGTLVLEVDDPAVSVAVEGTDLVITGAGAKEIRLKPGQYKVEASKDGKVVRQELVTVTRNGRQVVRISKESVPLIEAGAWEKWVATLPPEKQVEAVAQRLKELNPEFDGKVTPIISGRLVTGLEFLTDAVTDISPLRAHKSLRTLRCNGTFPRLGRLSDLTPLRGLQLTALEVYSTQVADLDPLRGMPLRLLHAGETMVADLSPLEGMKLQSLTLQRTSVTDLTPLRGMPLTWLDLFELRQVSDLSPLQGMRLEYLNVTGLPVSDLSLIAGIRSLRELIVDSTPVTDLGPLRGLPLTTLGIWHTSITDLTPLVGMPLRRLQIDYRPDREEFVRSFQDLEFINLRPAAEFWKEVRGP